MARLGLLELYRDRLRRDDAVTEVIGYVFMFAIGAMALIFSMEILTDAQERGNDLATAQQADRIGQVAGSLVEQAARVAQESPNSSYETKFKMPDAVGQQFSVEVTRTLREDPASSPPTYYNPRDCDYRATLHVRSTNEQVATSFPLGNISTIQIDGDCLEFRGEVDTSAEAAMVRYERSADTNARPVIFLEPTTPER